jgi:hypothetical protein
MGLGALQTRRGSGITRLMISDKPRFSSIGTVFELAMTQEPQMSDHFVGMPTSLASQEEFGIRSQFPPMRLELSQSSPPPRTSERQPKTTGYRQRADKSLATSPPSGRRFDSLAGGLSDDQVLCVEAVRNAESVKQTVHGIRDHHSRGSILLGLPFEIWAEPIQRSQAACLASTLFSIPAITASN